MIVEKMVVYCDQPQCFVGRLAGGERMLCMLVEESPRGRIFLGVSLEQARKVLAGTEDYRALLEKPDTEAWRIEVPWSGGMESAASVDHPLPEEWLPEAGLFLKPFDGEGFESERDLNTY